MNGAERLREKLNNITQAQLIKDFNKISEEYFDKMSQDNRIFDDQTTTDVYYILVKDNFLINVKLNVIYTKFYSYTFISYA